MRMLLACGVLLGLVFLTACGDDDDENGDAGGATDVNVTLQEWSVVPDRDSAPAGRIAFSVTNQGPDDPHEMEIFRTDLEPDALPTKEDGSVDSSAAGLEEIDEVEELAVGEEETLTVTLERGTYVLVCNIVEEEDGETEAHYEEGMRTGFTVE